MAILLSNNVFIQVEPYDTQHPAHLHRNINEDSFHQELG